MSVRKVLVPNIANHSSILIDVAGMFLKFAFIKFRFLVDDFGYSVYTFVTLLDFGYSVYTFVTLLDFVYSVYTFWFYCSQRFVF
jgi:hypothetical protein